jgi:fructose-bisphosphate aldolase class I
MSVAVQQLQNTVRDLLAGGKGLLAADESTGTITKRFEAVGVESTEDTRRAFRELMFSTPDVEQWLGGVILYDETIRQSTSDGTPLVGQLVQRGIVPGIKVDKGAKPLALRDGEKVTEGLDGLRERFEEYRDLGARFAKWRAVIELSDDLPTEAALVANGHAMARYAALAQEAGLVPIVEPEAIMDGTQTIDRSAAVSEAMLRELFTQISGQGVVLEGLLVKTNMVVSGYRGEKQAGPEEVADRTVEVLRRTVPAAVPGIVFLSGGQTDDQATQNLDAIARRGPHPWTVSFSYARALQGAAMQAWAGKPDNTSEAQEIFRDRVRRTAAANRGELDAA